MFIGRERGLGVLDRLYISDKFGFMVIYGRRRVEKAPLYGRRTSQMKILSFNLADTCRYLKNFSGEGKALIYGMVGGMPQ